MKNLTTFRDAGSLVAGLLIGLSIVVAVFVMTMADLGDGRSGWALVTATILALGLALQIVVTRPRQRPAKGA